MNFGSYTYECKLLHDLLAGVMNVAFILNARAWYIYRVWYIHILCDLFGSKVSAVQKKYNSDDHHRARFSLLSKTVPTSRIFSNVLVKILQLTCSAINL